jgi:hypothetical protein
MRPIVVLLGLLFMITACEGPAGDAGPMGPAGDQGATGATGATGGRGTQGVAGPQGPAGPAGPSGAAGETYLADFDSEDDISTWFKADAGSWRVDTGQLFMAGGVSGNLMQASPSRSFANDLELTVETEWHTGIENFGYGVQFASQAGGAYGFSISGNGGYALHEWSPTGAPVSLIDWTGSDAIQRNSTNTLGVIRSGDLIQLFINGTMVDEVTDDSNSGGRVTLMVQDLQEVSFDNFRIVESGVMPLTKPVYHSHDVGASSPASPHSASF